MTPPPLLGVVVGVTADRRAEEQTLLLEHAGAKVVHAPTVRTAPLDDCAVLQETTRGLIAEPPEVVLATTGIGVRGWFSAAAAAGLGQELHDVLVRGDVYARGPKAAGALVAHGLDPAAVAASGRTAELVDVVAERHPPGVRVAVQLDGSLGGCAGAALRARGADVVEVSVYRCTPADPPDRARRLVDSVAERRVDAVTCTSAAALRNLVDLATASGLGDGLVEALATDVALACVGSATAAAARAHGIEPAAVPGQPRLGAMVAALVDHLATPHTVRVAGTPVVLRRAAVVVGGDVVELSARERAVLEVLAERPGAVVSRDSLGRMAWPERRADDHTIGVTVARLRRRLGRLGRAVETVPRRGYRLVP